MPTVTVRHDTPGRAFQVRRVAPDGVPAVLAVLPYSEHPASAMQTRAEARRLAERVAAVLRQDDLGEAGAPALRPAGDTARSRGTMGP